MNYDPNLTNSGRTAVQTVKLTFGMWDYRAEYTTTVGGNCTGLTVIDCAVGRIYDDLCGDDEDTIPEILMKNEDGDGLICEDDDAGGEDWLKDMLIAAEITAIEPKPDSR